MGLCTNGPPGAAKLTALSHPHEYCSHDKIKNNCPSTTICTHGKRLTRCKECPKGGGGICPCGKERTSVVVDHYVHVEGLSESAGNAEEKAYVSMDANTTSVRSVMTLLSP